MCASLDAWVAVTLPTCEIDPAEATDWRGATANGELMEFCVKTGRLARPGYDGRADRIASTWPAVGSDAAMRTRTPRCARF
ncbi:hypothetical protein WT55_05780 [Burkholderia pseudomultivorans]|nr:hypothetical protein WT55_05780 [Burkholderia pseudomultivorans]